MTSETAPPRSARETTEFEQHYRKETRELLANRLRLCMRVAVPLYLVFWALDWVVYPDHVWEFLGLRLLWSAMGVGVLVALRTPWGRRRVGTLNNVILYSGTFILCAMCHQTGGFDSAYYLGVLFAIFVISLVIPWRRGAAAAYGISATLAYSLPNLLIGEYTLAEALLPTFFLASTALVGVFAADALDKMRRKDLEQRIQLEFANEELAALDEAKTKFFANVSHELRTPLMLILGPLESLQRGQSSDPASMLRAMNTNAHRLLRQVNMILNFSKLEAGKLEISRELGNVGATLENLAQGAAPTAERQNITLAREGLDALPDIPVDMEQIETCAANLLSNAMKFTPEGGRITVRAGTSERGIWFEVEDTGCGIPEDQIDKVFERFHQVDGGKGGKIQGTGLGLAFSKEIVEMHGGTMTASSRLGEGTTFHVELPNADAVGWSAEETADHAREGSEAAASKKVERMDVSATQFADLAEASLDDAHRDEAPADAPQLLVVEDNPDMRGFIAQSLSSNYRVATAVDGEDGLAKARRVRPDLIVSDVMMPKMDGFEMVAELRKDKSFDKTPIIMLTARTGSESVVKGLELGAVDYVNKPFKLQEIEARIAAQLRMKEMETALDERDSRLVAVGQMTGTIAHDLRGPLTGVFNRMEIVRLLLQAHDADCADGLGGTLDEHLSATEDSVRRVNGMIQELLEFVRGNEIRLKREPMKVGAFLDTVRDGVAPSMEAAGVDLEVDLDGAAEHVLELDGDRMQRVLENLVNNSRDAIVHSERGGHVWLQAKRDGDAIVLRVADDGPGIPDEVAENLFQPFNTSGKPNGTGLGLVIVRNLVVAHGGSIECDREPPEGGTAFVIRIPVDADARSEANEEPTEKRESGQAPPGSRPAAN